MTGIEWGMGLGGILWMIVGVLLVAVLLWALATALAGRDRPVTNDAASILAARYARGEISQAEYEQARHVLGLGEPT
jgi:Predicted membrane protein (DUF2078).